MLDVLTHILFLNEEIDGRQIMSDVFCDDLRLDLVDPSVDVITALFVQNMFICVEQFLAFVDSCTFEFLPLTLELVKTRLDFLLTELR